MDLCPSCGLVAPQGWSQCAACGVELPARRPSVERAPEDPWCVGLRVQLQCRSCQRLSPIDHLDLDGTVRCRHCKVEQAFPPVAWQEALRLAANVGDLAGPDPDGRVRDPCWALGEINPYRKIGVDKQSLSTTIQGSVRSDGLKVSRALSVELAPGHPLCASCHLPLKLAVGPARTTGTCAGCGQGRTWRNPSGLDDLAPGLVSALAEQHAEDSPAMTLGLTRSGPRGLSCPGCGAPLPMPDAGAIVTCPFCSLSSRLPDAVADSLPAKPLWWWLVFRGPSAERLRLLRDPSTGGPAPGSDDLPIQAPPPVVQSAPRRALQWAIVLGYGGAALALTGLALALGLLRAHRWPPW